MSDRPPVSPKPATGVPVMSDSVPQATRFGLKSAESSLRAFTARMANGISPSSIQLAQTDWFSHLVASSSKQIELAGSASVKMAQWMLYVHHFSCGGCNRCIDPHARDKRFVSPEWKWPPYNLMAQAFLLQERWWSEATTGVRGVSPHHEDVVAFMARQWLDMFSPSNGITTNPQVIAKTLLTGGTNLANGFTHWWQDVVTLLNDGRPRGVERFCAGRDVAVTPGRVVMRNHLIEVIEYRSTTAHVDAEPVLIVPSWIMKYYILDLEPANSMVKYLVDQGHRVFMVSWRNPDASDQDLGMDDYLHLGVLAALETVRKRASHRPVHCVGYCLGGTLLSIAAAASGVAAPRLMASLTLLAAQTDFAEPGELGLLIDESQIAFLEDLMADQGFLDGRQMAGAFALINSRDLVWSKLVHEYLMGAETPMTALRAWNADATRLPARMHSQYLRGLYLQNDLAKGRFRVGTDAVSLTDIKIPMFVLAAEQDHVSPWQSVYKIHDLTHAPTTFVLASGGHNVGIVSPPSGPMASPLAHYRIATSPVGHASLAPETWKDAATVVQGSWWPGWHQWLRKHSSAKIPSRPIARAESGLGLVETPGTYVHQV